MDPGSILVAYNGLRAAKDVLTTVIQGKVEVDTQTRVAEAFGKLGAAQDTLFELRDELLRLQDANAKLAADLAARNEWRDTIAAYDLTKTAGGAVVYRARNPPEHYACPACVTDRKLQILQDNRTYSGKYRCVACKAEYPVEPHKQSDPYLTLRRS
jgi:hypothetical protein